MGRPEADPDPQDSAVQNDPAKFSGPFGFQVAARSSNEHFVPASILMTIVWLPDVAGRVGVPCLPESRARTVQDEGFDLRHGRTRIVIQIPDACLSERVVRIELGICNRGKAGRASDGDSPPPALPDNPDTQDALVGLGPLPPLHVIILLYRGFASLLIQFVMSQGQTTCRCWQS